MYIINMYSVQWSRRRPPSVCAHFNFQVRPITTQENGLFFREDNYYILHVYPHYWVVQYSCRRLPIGGDDPIRHFVFISILSLSLSLSLPLSVILLQGDEQMHHWCVNDTLFNIPHVIISFYIRINQTILVRTIPNAP